MTLLGEARNNLVRCSTPFLIDWVKKYTKEVKKEGAYVGGQYWNTISHAQKSQYPWRTIL